MKTNTAMLSSSQKKFLRGQAHDLKPVVLVGKNGITETFLNSVDQALEAHELIKVKFVDLKEDRKILTDEIAQKVTAEVAGIIGNIAILFRQNKDPEKQKISLPSS